MGGSDIFLTLNDFQEGSRGKEKLKLMHTIVMF